MGILQIAFFAASLTAFAGIGITAWYEHHVASELQQELKDCQTQKVIAQTEVENFKAQVDQQNSAIQQIKKDSADREAAAAKAAETAQKIRDKKIISAASILSQKVDANDCVGAQQVLSSYLVAR